VSPFPFPLIYSGHPPKPEVSPSILSSSSHFFHSSHVFNFYFPLCPHGFFSGPWITSPPPRARDVKVLPSLLSHVRSFPSPFLPPPSRLSQTVFSPFPPPSKKTYPLISDMSSSLSRCTKTSARRGNHIPLPLLSSSLVIEEKSSGQLRLLSRQIALRSTPFKWPRSLPRHTLLHRLLPVFRGTTQRSWSFLVIVHTRDSFPSIDLAPSLPHDCPLLLHNRASTISPPFPLSLVFVPRGRACPPFGHFPASSPFSFCIGNFLFNFFFPPLFRVTGCAPVEFPFAGQNLLPPLAACILWATDVDFGLLDRPKRKIYPLAFRF